MSERFNFITRLIVVIMKCDILELNTLSTQYLRTTININLFFILTILKNTLFYEAFS